MKGSFVSSLISGLVLSLVLSFGASLAMYFSGDLVFAESLDKSLFKDKVYTKSFKVTDPKTLYELKITSPFLDNEWVYYKVNTLSKDGKNKFSSMPITYGYYSGGHGADHWSEGNCEDKRYFKLQKGEYKFSISGEGGRSEKPNVGFKTKTKIILRKNVVSGDYTFRWFLICIVGLFFIFIIVIMVESR